MSGPDSDTPGSEGSAGSPGRGSGDVAGNPASSTEPEPVGFIGLGQIGGPMARQLLGWPGGLIVHDVVAENAAKLEKKGAVVASSPAEVAKSARVISVMVRDDEQVTEVLSGPRGILTTAAAGTVVAIHSTVKPETPVVLAKLAAKSEVNVIDAPVSGGAIAAHSGELALMVGGADDAVERARGPLAHMATLIAHMGPVGAGTRAKLARNLITFASFVAVGEALRLAEAGGADLAKLGDVVRHSDRLTGGPGAVMLRNGAGPLDADDGLRPIFEHTRGLGEKDLSLALSLGSELGVDMPVAALAHELLGAALGVPHG